MPGIAICNSQILSSGSPPWTPAALSPTLWLGAYEEARATKAAQPVLVDGDMEAAGTAAWNPVRCVLTKETGAPHSGVRSLRLTVNSDAYIQYANQSILTVGHRLSLAAYAKTDSSRSVIVGDNVVSPTAKTIGTAWDTVAKEWTCAHKALLLGADTIPIGAWVEFDDLTLANLSITSYTPKIGAALTQATATAMPWAAALGMMFDGDLMPWGGAADAKCMHTGDGGSLGWQYRPTTLKAENRIVATAATAVGNVGVTVSCTNANTIRVRVMNGGAAYDYDSGDVACAIAINTTYTMVLRVATGAGGVSLRVNGVEVISGALTAPSAANATTGLMFGGDAAGAASNVTGYIGKGLLVPRALTVAECAQFEAYCAAGATL